MSISHFHIMSKCDISGLKNGFACNVIKHDVFLFFWSIDWNLLALYHVIIIRHIFSSYEYCLFVYLPCLKDLVFTFCLGFFFFTIFLLVIKTHCHWLKWSITQLWNAQLDRNHNIKKITKAKRDGKCGQSSALYIRTLGTRVVLARFPRELRSYHFTRVARALKTYTPVVWRRPVHPGLRVYGSPTPGGRRVRKQVLPSCMNPS